MAKYKCPTLGDCDKANAGEVFERSPGEDLKCPACGTLLEPQMTTGGGPVRKGNGKALVAAGLALALVAGGGYAYKQSTKVPVPVPVPAPALVPVPVPAPAPAAMPKPVEPGIAPSEAETQKLRKESDAQLARGEAVGAEVASSKATVNEMLKLAIAKMAQGKLDEADKELKEVRIRAPKEPLGYYNMAILRLKQGKTDDAIKEMEACFMAGFSYFDKMDQDTDLQGLRKNPRFAALVAKYRALAK